MGIVSHHNGSGGLTSGQQFGHSDQYDEEVAVVHTRALPLPGKAVHRVQLVTRDT